MKVSTIFQIHCNHCGMNRWMIRASRGNKNRGNCRRLRRRPQSLSSIQVDRIAVHCPGSPSCSLPGVNQVKSGKRIVDANSIVIAPEVLERLRRWILGFAIGESIYGWFRSGRSFGCCDCSGVWSRWRACRWCSHPIVVSFATRVE